jgi:hypothetical protein
MPWLSASQKLSTNIGTAIPDLYLDVPAGGRLVRFITEPVYWGCTTWIGNTPVDLGPPRIETFVELTGGGYSTRFLFRNYEVPNHNLVGLTETTARAITRSWTLLQSAGSREIGTVQECSYGGLGHAAMRLRFSIILSRLGGTYASPIDVDIRFRALYL